MREIKMQSIDDHELKNALVRVGDLIYTDEPVLCLFKDKRNNDLYLFDWCDADDKYNRWIVYKVEKYLLASFVKKTISFKSIFNTVNRFLVFDLLSGSYFPTDIYELMELPHEYMPDTDLLFDESDARNLDKIKSVLQNQ